MKVSTQMILILKNVYNISIQQSFFFILRQQPFDQLFMFFSELCNSS